MKSLSMLLMQATSSANKWQAYLWGILAHRPGDAKGIVVPLIGLEENLHICDP